MKSTRRIPNPLSAFIGPVGPRLVKIIWEHKGTSFLIVMIFVVLLTLGLINKISNRSNTTSNTPVIVPLSLSNSHITGIWEGSPSLDLWDEIGNYAPQGRENLIKIRKKYREKKAPLIPLPKLTNFSQPSVYISENEISDFMCSEGIWKYEMEAHYTTKMSSPNENSDDFMYEVLKSIKEFYEEIYINRWGYMLLKEFLGEKEKGPIIMEKESNTNKGTLTMRFAKSFRFRGETEGEVNARIYTTIQAEIGTSFTMDDLMGSVRMVEVKINAKFREEDDR